MKMASGESKPGDQGDGPLQKNAKDAADNERHDKRFDNVPGPVPVVLNILPVDCHSAFIRGLSAMIARCHWTGDDGTDVCGGTGLLGPTQIKAYHRVVPGSTVARYF